MSGKYLMVLPVAGFRVSEGSFAMDGAFVEHLRMLKGQLGPLAEELTIAGPEADPATYESQKRTLTTVVEAEEGIRFRPLFPYKIGRIPYFLKLPEILAKLREEVERADVVHSNGSRLYRPFELPALLMAQKRGKTTISITDIDNRESPKMRRLSGDWSMREYLWTKAIHANWDHFQQQIIAKRMSLVLLKGVDLAKDYAQDRGNVKFFLDSAFSEEVIIPADRLAEKTARVRSGPRTLEACYFGRLVGYKGIDRMLKAVKKALDLGANVKFNVIGSGPEDENLKSLTKELGIGDHVHFFGAIPFGPQLFDLLYRQDLLLAAPLSQDTPRSALDAAAAGIPILAFDTYYYRDLAELGAAVTTVPWPNEDEMGVALARIAAEPENLAQSMERSVDFARSNTQEQWLTRRVTWTKQAFANTSTGLSN